MRTGLAALVGSIGLVLVSIAPAHAQLEITVFEYYNTSLDHYFLALQAESDFIDAGNAGQGWRRTGHSFRTSILSGEPVCRFYGSFEIGPNSHFFTNNDAECQWLKHLQATTPDNVPRWNFEGLSFRAGIPVNGRCEGVYTRPITRFYNRGSELGIDSNHRYTWTTAAEQEAYGKGWRWEGVVFCVLMN